MRRAYPGLAEETGKQRRVPNASFTLGPFDLGKVKSMGLRAGDVVRRRSMFCSCSGHVGTRIMEECRTIALEDHDMHSFAELIDRCTAFTLQALETASDRTVKQLETSGATSLVKTLQMVQLQKAVLAVGMFSLFEAMLQDGLNADDGFREAGVILDREGETDLKDRFDDLRKAINVLKHGRGSSYDALVAKAQAGDLPFKVKLPGQAFFFEGDVSEVPTLIEVDDTFVLSCAEVIRDVSATIERSGRYFI